MEADCIVAISSKLNVVASFNRCRTTAIDASVALAPPCSLLPFPSSKKTKIPVDLVPFDDFVNRAYRCSCPRWRSEGCGNRDRPPCTTGESCQPSWRTWPWSWSSRRCEAASGKRARTGRSTRWPWLRLFSCRRRKRVSKRLAGLTSRIRKFR